PDRDRLLRRTCTVLALANVIDFLAHELTGLRRGGLAFGLVTLRSFHRFLFRHDVASFFSRLAGSTLRADLQRNQRPMAMTVGGEHFSIRMLSRLTLSVLRERAKDCMLHRRKANAIRVRKVPRRRQHPPKTARRGCRLRHRRGSERRAARSSSSCLI